MATVDLPWLFTWEWHHLKCVADLRAQLRAPSSLASAVGYWTARISPSSLPLLSSPSMYQLAYIQTWQNKNGITWEDKAVTVHCLHSGYSVVPQYSLLFWYIPFKLKPLNGTNNSVVFSALVHWNYTRPSAEYYLSSRISDSSVLKEMFFHITAHWRFTW